MPELPEVEAVAETLRPRVVGRKIRCLHVLHAIAVRPQNPAKAARAAQGRRIDRVSRHGKYLILEMDRGIAVLHFKLDGQLVWFESVKQMLRRANQKTEKDWVHVDVAFELDQGVLGFADGRHFGRVYFYDSKDEAPGLNALGIDAMSNEFTAKAFAEAASKSKRPIKEFLLDQTKFAGIGNIYGCESLWRARIDPKRAAKSLKETEARRLHKAIVSVLRGALECCLHPAPDFQDPEWWFQGLEAILRVYGREGKACRRDGHAILRIEQAGRSTYYCAHCQR